MILDAFIFISFLFYQAEHYLHCVSTYPRERDRLEDPSVDGRIILRWILRKWDVGEWTDRSKSGYVQVAGTGDCGNEPSDSIKCGEFLD
jgi:hypothetical protein